MLVGMKGYRDGILTYTKTSILTIYMTPTLISCIAMYLQVHVLVVILSLVGGQVGSVNSPIHHKSYSDQSRPF